MKIRINQYLAFGMGIMAFISCQGIDQNKISNSFKIGDKVDSLNQVYVYYNNSVNNVEGRNVAADGYNIGLKYQCVEFVKRYYYEHLNHKMIDSYGHAKDFYTHGVEDGELNLRRNLIQFSNPSIDKPQVSDLLVFDATPFNRYGHVAIIAEVGDSSVEIIQQNPGPYSNSRETFKLNHINGKWAIQQNNVLGRLRKK